MKVAIVGGTGYGAVELIRFLERHPNIKEIKIVSHSQAGKAFEEAYPHMTQIVSQHMSALSIEELANEVEGVFFATPSSVSYKYVPALVDKGVFCIDLSGDFRLADPEQYEQWYGTKTAAKVDLAKAVYGLSELYHQQIKATKLVANPGCYPTATLLALLPALEHKVIKETGIIIDGKTGVSGAGRSMSLAVHFSEMNENTRAYNVCQHKHIPEIERYLSDRTNKEIQINFTPHIIPMTRGLMATIYADLQELITAEEIEQLYRDYYQGHTFVRIRPIGQLPATKEVYGSNYCDIGLQVDRRTNKLIIVSVIDNLVKGAAGQAIQNMNILNGWDEQLGLNDVPIYP
ncbi:N-acetyl-gamma-glutamyl-phosphate reductase [Amphibacillus marinus]|uniref:N-acetyl-gamma-glutamyl-phosphate reductase n=1 Tax=Amphibacillus marinus TaxID=872970 RepID=A0A1H8MIB3_9BACI|nr:N-acetyl-gamma-glutamyl-phosphate reductase [Amphibacillus marinus]SEO17023.1 N-acetyl-gamma-glutamyl-phosphate reductase [Amphibacillus marinus]